MERDMGSPGSPGSESTEAGAGEARGKESKARARGPEGRQGPFAELQDMVEGLVDGILQVAPAGSLRAPRLELVRAPEEYWVLLDLPGVERSQVEVTAMADELTVRGTRERPGYPDHSEIRRSERQYGSFRRTLRLPADADEEGIRAHLASGVLLVRIPRRTEGTSRKVEIETP